MAHTRPQNDAVGSFPNSSIPLGGQHGQWSAAGLPPLYGANSGDSYIPNYYPPATLSYNAGSHVSATQAAALSHLSGDVAGYSLAPIGLTSPPVSFNAHDGWSVAGVNGTNGYFGCADALGAFPPSSIHINSVKGSSSAAGGQTTDHSCRGQNSHWAASIVNHSSADNHQQQLAYPPPTGVTNNMAVHDSNYYFDPLEHKYTPHFNTASSRTNTAVSATTGLQQIEQGVANLGVAPSGSPMVTSPNASDTSNAVTDSSEAPPIKSWASIAKQPAKRSMTPLKNPGFSGFNSTATAFGSTDMTQIKGTTKHSPSERSLNVNESAASKTYVRTAPLSQSLHLIGHQSSDVTPQQNGLGGRNHPILKELHTSNEYNPAEFSLRTRGARYFVIKSYSEDDIHRAIKYNVWCSTEHGNKRLDSAYAERDSKGPIYLFFSVNGSGHFCGVAQMLSHVDYDTSTNIWSQDKWKGKFSVKWIYVKDVPNSQLRHIRLENNENKPVTNSRDTQEVPSKKGEQVLQIIHHYKHSTCIFDDFNHYESRQVAESRRKGLQGEHEQQDRGTRSVMK